MKWRRRAIVACGLSAAVLVPWLAWVMIRSHAAIGRLIQFGRSPALDDVIEPITIVDAMSFDDGGSQGLRFRDAKGVVRDVCLEGARAWGEGPSDSEGGHNIILNSFSPGGEKAQRVAVAGAEEQQLLGLLDRWARRDPDAKFIESRYDRYARGEIDIEAFWKELPADAHVKVTAVSILRELRNRN
jgi:hypothetical protein